MVPYCLEVQRIPFGSQMRDFTQIFSPNICNTTQTIAASKVNLTKYLGFTFKLILRYRYRFQKNPSPSLKDQIRLITVLHKDSSSIEDTQQTWGPLQSLSYFPQNTFPRDILIYLDWARGSWKEISIAPQLSFWLIRTARVEDIFKRKSESSSSKEEIILLTQVFIC